MPASPKRRAVAVALLVALALATNVAFLVRAIRWVGRSGPDLATYYQARFRPLRPLLPARGVVGYVSDDPAAGREYFLTQYTLVPLLVDRAVAHPVVVGNFFDPAEASAIAARRRLLLVRDLGEGVVLFRALGP